MFARRLAAEGRAFHQQVLRRHYRSILRSLDRDRADLSSAVVYAACWGTTWPKAETLHTWDAYLRGEQRRTPGLRDYSRKMFGVWRPLVQAHPRPGIRGCLDIQCEVLQAQRPSWALFVPLKCYLVVRTLESKLPFDFLQPMGSVVREAMRRLLGLAIGESAFGYNVSHALHVGLAHLARSDTAAINSGLWCAGDRLLRK